MAFWLDWGRLLVKLIIVIILITVIMRIYRTLCMVIPDMGSWPVPSMAWGKLAGPRCQHMRPCHRCDGRKLPSAASHGHSERWSLLAARNHCSPCTMSRRIWRKQQQKSNSNSNVVSDSDSDIVVPYTYQICCTDAMMTNANMLFKSDHETLAKVTSATVDMVCWILTCIQDSQVVHVTDTSRKTRSEA